MRVAHGEVVDSCRQCGIVAAGLPARRIVAERDIGQVLNRNRALLIVDRDAVRAGGRIYNAQQGVGIGVAVVADQCYGY